MYTVIVKNVTLSADETLIDRARMRAAMEKRTLNAAFREWLQRYAGADAGQNDYASLMKQLSHVRTTRRYSRDERNSR